MNCNTPNELALNMHGEASRSNGTVSVLLSRLRDALCTSDAYSWQRSGFELKSITNFAYDFGFEYTSLTHRRGLEICHFRVDCSSD